MATTVHVPDFQEAVASERIDRAIAFLPLLERICGIECAKLTPIICEYLRAYSNPFIIGGSVSALDIANFLWFTQPTFPNGDREAFKNRIQLMSESDLRVGIFEYLDRAFLDSPYGKAGKPYYALAAGVAFDMASDPYHWDYMRTMHEPLAVCFQLIKARDRARGMTVVNNRSDVVVGDWLDKLLVVSGKTPRGLNQKVSRMLKDGWEKVSEVSPRTELSMDGTLSVVAFDCAMQKKVRVNGN